MHLETLKNSIQNEGAFAAALETLKASKPARTFPGRSPRGRRSPEHVLQRYNLPGSISAWAEEPYARKSNALSCGVDLRVGGGASFDVSLTFEDKGRSPRGRRSPRLCIVAKHSAGSISAWAEEPNPFLRGQMFSGVDLRVGGGARAEG